MVMQILITESKQKTIMLITNFTIRLMKLHLAEEIFTFTLLRLIHSLNLAIVHFSDTG